MRRFVLVLITLTSLIALAPELSAQGKKKKGPVWSDQKDAFGDPLPIGAVARIGTMRYRLGESKDTQAIALSRDGKLFAALGLDGIEVWELPAWKRHKLIRARTFDKDNPPAFLGLAISPDGKKLVTFNPDQPGIYYLDIATGKAIHKLPCKPFNERNMNGAPAFTFLSGGDTLVFSSHIIEAKGPQFHEIDVWDLVKGKKLRSFRGPVDRSAAAMQNVISADGRWLALGTTEEMANAGDGPRPLIEIWDLNAGKRARKIDTDGAVMMNRLAFSPDGKWLASSNDQSLLRIYNAETGKEVHNMRIRRTPIDHLEFSPDSASLYVADALGKLTRWDPVKGEPVATHVLPDCELRFLAFPEAGKVLALGLNFDAVHLWDVTNNKRLSPAGLPEGIVTHVSFSPKGELFVAADDGSNAWWDPRAPRKLRDLILEPFLSDQVPAFGRGVGGDGIFGMPGFGGGGRLALGNVGRPRIDTPLLVTMSRSGEFLMGADGANIGFFDAKTGKVLYDVEFRNGDGNAVAFLGDGSKVAAIEGKKIRIWNTRSGRDLTSFRIPLREEERALRLDASPDGKVFAIATAGNKDGNGRILLWDVLKQKVIHEIATQGGLENMQFSPDNLWFAMTRVNDAATLFQLKGNKEFPLNLGLGGIESMKIAFSPDGRQLACAALLPQPQGETSRILIYEVASRKVRLELVGHPNAAIESLAYAPDSGLLATGSTDTTVLLWNTGLRAFAKGDGADAKDADLDDWYKKMADANPKVALQNMIQLAQHSKQTIKLLEAKIAPAKKPDAGEKPVPEWINDLGSGQFAVRSKANTMLQKIGAAVEPDLRAALPRAKDVETKRRIEELLEHFASYQWTPEELMQARAVEVIDAIETPEARALLTRWSGGDTGAVLTQQAQKSLDRSK